MTAGSRAVGTVRDRLDDRVIKPGLVEKPVHLLDPTILQDGDVESDRGRLRRARSTSVPGESNLLVVCVDRAGEPEYQAGVLLLDGLDERVDRVASGERGDGIDVGGNLGTKGIGELAAVGMGPAIANAVFHATGKPVRELPITPEKLLAG